MFTKKPAQVTDVAVLLPCCNKKQGIEIEKGKTMIYRQELTPEGRLDDVVLIRIRCNQCNELHEAEVCRLGYLPKELLNGTT